MVSSRVCGTPVGAGVITRVRVNPFPGKSCTNLTYSWRTTTLSQKLGLQKRIVFIPVSNDIAPLMS